MSRPTGRSQPPERFELFQLVRLLENEAAREHRDDAGRRHAGVGMDGPLEAESIRFRGVVSHRFPDGPVGEERTRGGGRSPLHELTTAVLGLTGPEGVLPRHYTSLLVERVRRRDDSLRDFLDLFHHRLVSLFHRAWRKHRVAVEYEHAAALGHEFGDLFSRCLLGVAGLGTGGLRGRDGLPESWFLRYAGHFGASTRPAAVLGELLREYFDLPIEIDQFEPQWLQIAIEARSTLPTRSPGETYNRLGIDAVVGDRVRDLQGRFRVRIGPIPYERFGNLAPGGAERAVLVQMVRAFVGPEFVFDLQLLLEPAEVPACQLDSGPAGDTRLGWNAWVRAEPFEEVRGDAVFAVDDA